MKLQIINEVFERPSMDGIEYHGNDTHGFYKFRDQGTEYDVEIFLRPRSLWNAMDSEARERVDDEQVQQLGEAIGNVTAATVYLTWSREGVASGRYGKSGMRNQWFVYGKLIASMEHFIKKHYPTFLMFSGADDDMELVYDRFIKMSGRYDPANAYIHYNRDVYVRQDVKELVETRFPELYPEIFRDKYSQTRAATLKQIKHEKNQQRASNKTDRGSSDNRDVWQDDL
jgi:hypothetical protein